MIKIDVDERKWEKIKEEHSGWYSDNILPNIKNAYKFIESQKSKSYSIKKYLELLKKIIDKGKDFIIQKELFLDYENKEIDKIIKIMKKKNKKSKSILEIRFEELNISEEYLPNQLFCYKKFQDGNKNWGRHKLLFLMEIEVCPYCQRNYISSYEENNSKKTTADLDHFYPKSLYPFLAFSLVFLHSSLKHLPSSIFLSNSSILSLSFFLSNSSLSLKSFIILVISSTSC